uniref:Uncharacterized protein n=1 Tax=Arundo donax TaxID=35708 RepID=A0A0A9AH64_ARUDO
MKSNPVPTDEPLRKEGNEQRSATSCLVNLSMNPVLQS